MLGRTFNGRCALTLPATVASSGPMEMRPAMSGEFLAELREYCVRVARRFGARQAAEDVAQDAMMAFLVAEQVLEPHAWLRTVVRRLVSRRFRDPHIYTYESVDWIPATGTSRSTAPADPVVLFRQVLRRLPVRDRRVLMLKLRGYSYGEMARQLGCPPSAVGTSVNRTFVRVRQLLQGDSESARVGFSA